jgi:sialate O-acetylesterase
MVLQRDSPITFWGLDTPSSSITVTYRGTTLPSTTTTAAGRFDVVLPSLPMNATPDILTVTSSSTGSVTLEDTLIGDLYVFSGQSNTAIPVSWSAYYADVIANVEALGPRLRLLQVAQLAEYVKATSPSDNFTASIPWSRASLTSVPAFSAISYHFGAAAAMAHPDLPIGVIASSWGGVALEVWASPAALARCNGTQATHHQASDAAARHSAELVARSENAVKGALGQTASPINPSCLYFSMLYPILSIPVKMVGWCVFVVCGPLICKEEKTPLS